MTPQRCGWRGRTALFFVFAASLGACGHFDNEHEDLSGDGLVLDCPVYCAVVMRRCQGSAQQFLSFDACITACAAYPTDGALGAASGNSLQCRFTFALAARKTTRYAFCRNAGPLGGVNCN